MTDAVIQASFTDIKNVKTRGVCQLVFEIPIEAAHHALNTLGYPMNSMDIPVAIARLIPEIKE